MIFLFEDVAYKTSFLKSVLPLNGKGNNNALPKGLLQKEKDGLRKLDGVGYLFNAESELARNEKESSHKIVFILPKVFKEECLDVDKKKSIEAFGEKISPDGNFKCDDLPAKISTEFLSQLSLWVCSSIGLYRLSNPADNDMMAPEPRCFRNKKLTPTLVDVMIAMKQFYVENKDLFVFVSINKCSGNNRIDWRRTIAHTQPFMQNRAPIYIELENKKKIFDLDDRLLVLYFSAMNYIEETFGFNMPKSNFYTPMRVNEFRRLLGHRGLMEMRRIKHKYFADKFLKLFNIVKAFFEWGGNFKANKFGSEYLITSKYNKVFETMIDKLVSDDLPKKMKHLKSQKDNKIVDHLYEDRQLVFADESQKIWFIGDSKYYKDGNKIEGSSIYKQYTYAKNIIQYNINDLLDYNRNEKYYKGMRYREKITEGYSVTPNFFIRGFVPSFDPSAGVKQFREPYFRKEKTHDLIINDDEDLDKPAEYLIVDDEGNPIDPQKNKTTLWALRNRHFINRLFDRDTLLLQTYNINFLYVLKAYTSKRSSLRNKFKHEARKRFRENFLNLLDKKYVFYAIWPKTADDDGKKIINPEKTFVDRHFRALVGKIFKPEGFRCLILALENISSKTKVFAEKEELEKMEKMWTEIEKDCVMIARVTPKEIWDDGEKELEEAEFKEVFFDKKLNGFFIREKDFEKAKIGKEHKLPGYLKGKLVAGNILKMGFPPKRKKNIKRDDYYFLPCKKN